MTTFFHLCLFFLAAAVIWLLSGMLINATDRVAKRYQRPGFAVAFFVLGFLTSIGEMSVAFNSTVQRVPQVSAGNLVGGAIVIFFLIIPLLAIIGNGFETTKALRPRNLAFLLLIVLLPSFFCIDGDLSRSEGIVMLLLYVTLIFLLQKKHPSEEVARDAVVQVGAELTSHRRATAFDISKIAFGAVVIFISGKVLVDEAVYFAELLQVPLSFIGLLLLAIGTNIPELVIAVRGVLGRHKDIAFGDYLGSAAANTLLIGLLAIVNGSFILERSEFIPAFLLMGVGFTLFFIFARTKAFLSRWEGWVLFLLYIVFMVFQSVNVVHLVPRVHGSATVQAEGFVAPAP
ncbi:MAG: sodium:calcium antiporter [Candidatus Peribacteraceae bacterium]|nr:sodium:calcium antiporter [Candidatus Peribacteraceae bacterium]